MKEYKANVNISREKFDFFNNCLITDFIPEGREDDTLLSLRGVFENNYEGILEVFTGEKSVMATYYLYSNLGELIGYIEYDESLEIEYSFDTSNDKMELVNDTWIEIAEFNLALNII